MNIDEISRINRARSSVWHDGADPWSGADWSNAMQGEAGEAGNVVKKLRRLETGAGGRSAEADPNELIDKLADEIADTFLYLDLLAAHYGITLSTAIVSKFNRTSAEFGFGHRLAEVTP